jgi:RHS repeat-associated protein
MKPEMYGELIRQRRSGATSFHHFDALGSTDKLTDSNAATLAEYLYKAFGEQTVVSGSSPNRFTWVGKLGYYRQPDAADYWVRARIVKPTSGRWLSRDPVRAANVKWIVRSLYEYVANRPTRGIDPSGLRPDGDVQECKRKCEEKYKIDRRRCIAFAAACVAWCQIEPTPFCELACMIAYTVCMILAKNDRARCIEDCEGECPVRP